MEVPWSRRYEVCFVCSATDLSSSGPALVGPTSSQDEGIDPYNCNTDQYWKSFENRYVP